MLKKLRIQNFKGWKDTGSIQMNRISLFFGPNNSGKSSIGQFLMMLKQTIDESDRKTIFYLGGKNSAVQLGSYQNMVFQHDFKNNISFEYQWNLDDVLKFKDTTSGKPYSVAELVFRAVTSQDDKDQLAFALDKFQYELNDGKNRQFLIGMERTFNTKSCYKVEAKDYSLQRKQEYNCLSGVPIRFYGFPNNVATYYQNAAFVQLLNLQNERLFRSICYIGPFRTKPERLYSWTGIEPESVGYAGENTVAAILAAKKRKISLSSDSQSKNFEEIIAIKLKEMDLIDELKISPISDERQEYEVKVRTKGSEHWVCLPDAGLGISQVLSVLVQCFYAPSGSIIIIDKPEIHLHPRAQSALADVMIDVINSRENGKDRNIQLVIETHSEHFLRRLQRRIAEDVKLKEKVSAYFANIAKTPTTLETLEIDDFGNIKNWPAKFFGDEMVDIVAQAEAAMRRRTRKRESNGIDGIE